MTEVRSKKALEKVDKEQVKRILSQLPNDALTFSVEIAGYKAVSDLNVDMLLGENRENPFEINRALDEQSPQVVMWGTIKVRAEELVAELTEKIKISESRAKVLLRKAIEAEGKNPTIDRTNDAFEERFVYFHHYGSDEGRITADVKEGMKKRVGKLVPKEYVSALKQYLQLRYKLTKTEAALGEINVLYTSWVSRSYNLSAMANTVRDMISSGILVVSTGRQVDLKTGKRRWIDVESFEKE